MCEELNLYTRRFSVLYAGGDKPGHRASGIVSISEIGTGFAVLTREQPGHGVGPTQLGGFLPILEDLEMLQSILLVTDPQRTTIIQLLHGFAAARDAVRIPVQVVLARSQAKTPRQEQCVILALEAATL